MTGYTHDLIDHDQTFAEFAMACAHAFFRCEQAVDDLEAVSYHQRQIARATEQIAPLTAMTEQEQYAYGYRSKDKQIQEWLEIIRDSRTNVARLQVVLDQANAWEPTTPDHHGLKEFIIQQLANSIEDEYLPEFEKRLEQIKQQSPLAIYQVDLEQIQWNLYYHRREAETERERRQQIAEWTEQLRESLAAP